MAIKVTFPTGVDTVTSTKKLHQWDYGQQLEIESVDLSPIIEVHFACQGMSEAEVRPCTVTNGIATVDIPDRCLEQAANITAWVFEINGTRGMTTKTITIPVIARTRPSKSEEIPQEFKDCYTELISEVNEAIRVLQDGDVVAKYATAAGSASSANTAGHANTAGRADTAGSAESAGHANTADALNGKPIGDFVGVGTGFKYGDVVSLDLNTIDYEYHGFTAAYAKNTPTNDSVGFIDVSVSDGRLLKHTTFDDYGYASGTYDKRIIRQKFTSYTGKEYVRVKEQYYKNDTWVDIAPFSPWISDNLEIWSGKKKLNKSSSVTIEVDNFEVYRKNYFIRFEFTHAESETVGYDYPSKSRSVAVKLDSDKSHCHISLPSESGATRVYITTGYTDNKLSLELVGDSKPSHLYLTGIVLEK